MEYGVGYEDSAEDRAGGGGAGGIDVIVESIVERRIERGYMACDSSYECEMYRSLGFPRI